MSKPGTCTIIGGGLIATAGALTLEARGWSVTVVTRAPPPLGGKGIAWNYGDVTSASAYHAVTEAESVIYAAGTLGPATQLENVHGAVLGEIVPVLKLSEEAAASGTRTFVFISSGGTVYGPDVPLPTSESIRTAPITIYGTLKVLAEQALLAIGRKYGMSIVILRVANPYGPGQSGTRRMGFIAAVVKAAMAGHPIVIWGDGSTTRDFVYIDDVGAALASAAAYRNESVILNIGSGQECSLLQVCRLVSKNSHLPLQIEFDEKRTFDVPRSVLDISRAAEVLGWQPHVTLDDGIARMMSRGAAMDSD